MPVGYSTLTVAAATTIASSWGNNVRDSVITQHASYAALTSAITSPSEGMVSYLTDSDTFWFYKNTSWRLLPDQFLYAKWDTSTSYFTNHAAGTVDVFTSSTITIPSGGSAPAQAFECAFHFPVFNGGFTNGQVNGELHLSINAGAFSALCQSGFIATNSVSGTWCPQRSGSLYKAAAADATVAMKLKAGVIGGNFDVVASSNFPLHLWMRTTGMLSSEVS